ncbi:uncharacterized protein LOC136718378 [Amia ocellicauda]|uniref:uncharacterized protein LOC136718378 n=1 Tax=Amia ocellicauda TaxID=2972642 RepID=UPI003464217C
MSSEIRQPVQHRVLQQSTLKTGPWLNGLTFHNRTGFIEQYRQPEPNFFEPSRRREMGFMAQGRREGSFVREVEPTEPSCNGQDQQRRVLLLAGPQHRRQPGLAEQNCMREPGSDWQHRSGIHRPRYVLATSFTAGQHPRELDSIGHNYLTEPHRWWKKHGVQPASKGQENHTEAVSVEEKLGSTGENPQKLLTKPGLGHSTLPGFNKQCCQISTLFSECNREQGPSESRRNLVSFARPMRRPEPGCGGPNSVQHSTFPAEVSQIGLDCAARKSHPKPGDVTQSRPNQPAGRQQEKRRDGTSDQKSVRDQIKKVVLNLEEVLGGLKQVHGEMREVVQQIEKLTSNIDLTGEEPSTSDTSDTLRSSGSSGVVVSSASNVGGQPEGSSKQVDVAFPSLKSSPIPPSLNPQVIVTTRAPNHITTPAELKGRPPGRVPISATPGCPQTQITCSPRLQTQGMQNGKGLGVSSPSSQYQTNIQLATQGGSKAVGSEGLHVPRSQKPPPYPHNGDARRLSEGRAPAELPLGSRKAPPYPVKCRLLSTTV